MNGAARVYKASEDWMFRTYDGFLIKPAYRSIVFWGINILFVLTILGGVDLLHGAWSQLNDKSRLALPLGLAWTFIPWARSLQLRVMYRKALDEQNRLPETEQKDYRQAITTSVLSVLATCAAVNSLLKVIADLL